MTRRWRKTVRPPPPFYRDQHRILTSKSRVSVCSYDSEVKRERHLRPKDIHVINERFRSTARRIVQSQPPTLQRRFESLAPPVPHRRQHLIRPIVPARAADVGEEHEMPLVTVDRCPAESDHRHAPCLLLAVALGGRAGRVERDRP